MGWGVLPNGRVTRRQHYIMLLWLGEEWDRPTKTEYYLMQIACEARRVFSRKPDKIKMEHFKLEFGSPLKRRRDKPEDTKNKWIGALSSAGGMGVMKDKDGNIIQQVEKKQKPTKERRRKKGPVKGTMYVRE